MIPIFSFRIAYQVIKDGHQPIKVEVNRKCENQLVYWFPDTQEIRSYLPNQNS